MTLEEKYRKAISARQPPGSTTQVNMVSNKRQAAVFCDHFLYWKGAAPSWGKLLREASLAADAAEVKRVLET